jgi:hypothetical protein
MSALSTRRVDGEVLGKATGSLWAEAVVMLGLTARQGWGEWHDLLSDVYLGYDSSNQGLVVGAVWAFADGVCRRVSSRLII